MMKSLMKALLGLEESMKLNSDGVPAEDFIEVRDRFFDRLEKSLDDALKEAGADFYTHREVYYQNLRHCKAVDYIICSQRDGFAAVKDWCARILKDGRHVHVVYYEIWDSETPLTFVVRDVVIREPREV